MLLDPRGRVTEPFAHSPHDSPDSAGSAAAGGISSVPPAPPVDPGELGDHVPEALCCFDSEGRVVGMNAEASGLTGYAPGQLGGRSFTTLVPRSRRGPRARSS